MFTRVKVLECSAKDDYNIMEIFRTFVTLSRILPVNGSAESGSGLKRRSSAYVSASSKGRCGQHRSTVYTARRLFIMSSTPPYGRILIMCTVLCNERNAVPGIA